MTTRNAAQKICSQRPWKIRRKTRMLPIAPSKPITAYNRAIISPPMNWLLDPAPAIRFCSNAESIIVAPLWRHAQAGAVLYRRGDPKDLRHEFSSDRGDKPPLRAEP